MADPNQNKDEEWRIWFPIDSKVNDDEIAEIEDRIGHQLPDDYKAYLKHKHFYELRISDVSFFTHPVNIWKTKLMEMILDNYPTEYLIEKGYIPFAYRNDWGLLCFDTNISNGRNNYPIVLWDHESPDDVQNQYNDFYELILKLDEEERKDSR